MRRTNVSIDRIQAISQFSSNNYLSINKQLIQAYGLVEAAFLSNLIDKFLYFHSAEKLQDDWFFQKHELQMKTLNITEQSIRKCKTLFIEEGIIEVRRKGIPAKEWYRINIIVLLEKLKGLVLSVSIGQEDEESVGLYKELKDKELKDKDKKINKKDFFISLLPDDWKNNTPLINSISDFVEHRKIVKPKEFNEISITKMVNAMRKSTIDDVIEKLDTAVMSGWAGAFFPNKGGNKPIPRTNRKQFDNGNDYGADNTQLNIK